VLAEWRGVERQVPRVGLLLDIRSRAEAICIQHCPALTGGAGAPLDAGATAADPGSSAGAIGSEPPVRGIAVQQRAPCHAHPL